MDRYIDAVEVIDEIQRKIMFWHAFMEEFGEDSASLGKIVVLEQLLEKIQKMEMKNAKQVASRTN